MVNPAAGRGRTRKLLPELTGAFAASGLEIDLHVSDSMDGGRKVAQRAFEDGQGVIACGGDGTVGEIAGLAAETGGTLGVVPTGAGNDFARHLGIDHRRPLAAVDVIRAGHVRTMDIGRATTDAGDVAWFSNVANTGFDSEANRWANTVTRVRGTSLYVLAMLRTLATYSPQPFRVTLDGDTRDVSAWFIAIGNTRYYAGGMMITPGAVDDDGLLEVCVVGPVSRPGFLWSFPKVFRGTHVSHPLVDTYRAREVRIEAPDSPLPLEVYGSGERIGPLPARLEVVPRALNVLAPAP